MCFYVFYKSHFWYNEQSIPELQSQEHSWCTIPLWYMYLTFKLLVSDLFLKSLLNSYLTNILLSDVLFQQITPMTLHAVCNDIYGFDNIWQFKNLKSSIFGFVRNNCIPIAFCDFFRLKDIPTLLWPSARFCLKCISRFPFSDVAISVQTCRFIIF